MSTTGVTSELRFGMPLGLLLLLVIMCLMYHDVQASRPLESGDAVLADVLSFGASLGDTLKNVQLPPAEDFPSISKLGGLIRKSKPPSEDYPYNRRLLPDSSDLPPSDSQDPPASDSP